MIIAHGKLTSFIIISFTPDAIRISYQYLVFNGGKNDDLIRGSNVRFLSKFTNLYETQTNLTHISKYQEEKNNF